MDEITDKQKAFVEEYLIDLNATQAAIRAGYSEKSAQQIGSDTLSKHVVQQSIQKAFNERSKRTQLTADRILEELMKLSFINPKELYDEDGNLKPIHELPDNIACAIASIDVGEVKMYRDQNGEPEEAHRTKKIKFWDKRGSLELLGKHLKLFTDKVEHSGGIDFANELKKISDAIESNPELEKQLEDEISD